MMKIFKTIKIMLRDKDTISDEHSELKYVADKLGVQPSDVLRAKEIKGTSSRKVIEEYIISQRDQNVAEGEGGEQDDN